MGWRSWNWFACDIDQTIMEDMATALTTVPSWATKSLQELGYNHIGLVLRREHAGPGLPIQDVPKTLPRCVGHWHVTMIIAVQVAARISLVSAPSVSST